MQAAEKWLWLVAALAASLAAAQAHAVPPDIMKYCKELYPDSEPPHSADTTPYYCYWSKDGQALRLHIDMAIACQKTTGSEEFNYVDGFKIDCAPLERRYVEEGPRVLVLTPEEGTRYCELVFGAGARAQRSETLRRNVCVRAGPGDGPGEITMNLAVACSYIHKTDRIRHVRSGDRDHIACVK
jgi:hypothetical protein